MPIAATRSRLLNMRIKYSDIKKIILLRASFNDIDMKRLIVLNLIFILLTVFSPYVTAEQDVTKTDYAAGLIWDSREDIEKHLSEEPPVEEALPASVDLTDTFPSPGNQGSQNSCAAWSVAYALKSHQEQASRDWGLDTDEHLFSPSYVYNQVNGGVDKGTTPESVMKILERQGVCSLSSFPYNVSDYTTRPTAEQKAEAGHFKIDDWFYVKGIENIKRHLSDGDGVIIGLEIFPDFRNLNPSNPIYDVVDGNSSGSHSVCLIGYDDEKSAFKFINSWGTDWGLGGYGWISYETFENPRVNMYGQSYGLIMKPRTYVFSESFFDYVVSNNGAELRSYFGLDTKVTIPYTLGGYPVTRIGYEAFDCSLVNEFIIPNSVTYISRSAFYCIDENGKNFLPPNLKLYCNNNSYAHQYAVENNIPFEIINTNIIDVSVLSNDENIIVKQLNLTNISDDLYNIAAEFKTSGEVFFVLAVYDENLMKNIFMADDKAEIKNITKSDLTNGKIFIWNRNMQPCIKAVTYKKY